MLFILGFVSWNVMYSKGYQAADEDHQSAYATHQTAEKIYDECASKTTIKDALSCYQNAYNTDREQERAEDDLDAQREMANWAEGMLWATLFIGSVTAAITALGVIYVARTLRATSQTLDATRTMANDQKRIGDAQVVQSEKAVLETQVANAHVLKQIQLSKKPLFKIKVTGPYIEDAGRGALQFGPDDHEERWTQIRCAVDLENISENMATIVRHNFFVFNETEIDTGRPRPTDCFVEVYPSERVNVHEKFGHYEKGWHEGTTCFAQLSVTPATAKVLLLKPFPIVGQIDYVDMFGTRWRRGFAYKPTRGWISGLWIWGGDEFNYDKQIDE
jgi:hypothetical protein